MPIYLMLSISVPPPSVRDFIVVGGGASFHNVCQGPLFGRDPQESSRALCETLFWEEPEKQRAAVPQDAGKTPSVCPSHRRAPGTGATSTNEKQPSIWHRQLNGTMFEAEHRAAHLVSYGSRAKRAVLFHRWKAC